MLIDFISKAFDKSTVYGVAFFVARGHFELVQLILETAVMTEGPERAKKNCIDHANSKRQTALMVACKHGCVTMYGQKACYVTALLSSLLHCSHHSQAS